MNTKRTDDGTRLARVYKDEEFIKALKRLDFATAADVAEYVGCFRNTAKMRLLQLEKQGAPVKSKLTSTGYIFYYKQEQEAE